MDDTMMGKTMGARKIIRTKTAAFGTAGLGVGLLALLAAPALADVKAGVDAWSAGDFSRAVVEWQGPAAAGDADALFNLAQAYRLGRGVEVDNARARKLYEEAARRGHVKAADNFGLMLFQEGEQEKAMPMVRAAAGRGDPRAQYVLGLSHFNADYAPRDWVRAYALMTLANSAGLPQASEALAQMDKYVPAAQRSQAQSLARDLDAEAKRQRSAELAAAELAPSQPSGAIPAGPALAGVTGGINDTSPASRPAVAPRPVPAVVSAPVPVPVPAPIPAPKPAAVPVTVAAAPSAPRPVAAAAVAPRRGNWRVQLGAFGVAANADRLWSQLAGTAALAGTRKTLVPSGNITRLLATGFASEAEASRACAALKAQGQACLVAGQG
jgi:uncharacterized protein